MSMRLTAVLTVGAALTLGACAVDSHMSYVCYLPDFLKQSSPAAEVEVPPDVPAILRSNINAVFVSTSAPTNIQYTLPVPADHGGWETCVKASVRVRLASHWVSGPTWSTLTTIKLAIDGTAPIDAPKRRISAYSSTTRTRAIK